MCGYGSPLSRNYVIARVDYTYINFDLNTLVVENTLNLIERHWRFGVRSTITIEGCLWSVHDKLVNEQEAVLILVFGCASILVFDCARQGYGQGCTS